MLLDLKLVVRLQEIDNRLAELSREIASLPKHIAEIQKKLGAHERKLDADRAALAANQKERKKCESDIPVQDLKISKLKDQMLATKTNEQYRAFQNEIEFCQKEIRRLEDRILEMMAESEPLEKNVKAAEAALKEEKAQVEAEKTVARERTAVDQKAASELHTERASIAKEITPATHHQYERVRKGRGGIAVAEVVDGRCGACYILLRPQYLQDVKRTESLLFCESCQRILYYNPPQAFDDLADSAGGTAE
jgi:predicted  nucleic acid-binding Zn-ribbon protein